MLQQKKGKKARPEGYDNLGGVQLLNTKVSVKDFVLGSTPVKMLGEVNAFTHTPRVDSPSAAYRAAAVAPPPWRRRRAATGRLGRVTSGMTSGMGCPTPRTPHPGERGGHSHSDPGSGSGSGSC